MGTTHFSKFPRRTLPPKTYKTFTMKAFIAAFALLSVACLTEAIVFPAIVGGSSAAGASIILGSTTAGSAASALVPTVSALVAGAVLIVETTRRKRSTAEEDNSEKAFAFIAANEPAACYKRLICDLATGALPASENEVILANFNKDVPITSVKYDFAIAANLGKALRNVEACEVRYSCPL